MRSDYPQIIGTTIRGTIDRPLGSHHPTYPMMIYPINYGYADDYEAEDGEKQDVYYLGCHHPVHTITGRVIAVYRRTDDREDKWIVTSEDTEYTDQEILMMIHFQEQYFHGYLLR